jgi:hypothetical protein
MGGYRDYFDDILDYKKMLDKYPQATKAREMARMNEVYDYTRLILQMIEAGASHDDILIFAHVVTESDMGDYAMVAENSDYPADKILNTFTPPEKGKQNDGQD